MTVSYMSAVRSSVEREGAVDALKKLCSAYIPEMCLSRSFKIGRPPNWAWNAWNGVINNHRWSWATIARFIISFNSFYIRLTCGKDCDRVLLTRFS